MPSLNSVSFDDTSFTLQGDQDGARVWHSAQGDAIGLFYFDKVPDISASLDSVDDLRSFYRSSVMAAGLAVIEIERLTILGVVAIRTVFKAPQESGGMTYLGAITLPFREFSYVIKAQCGEHGVTGVREAVLLVEMAGAGQVDLANVSRGEWSGWMQDPYDASVRAPLMRNLAEDERYDARFPDHPLSRVRSILGHLQSSVRIDPEVLNAAPYIFEQRVNSGSQKLGRRPWWKIW